MCLVQAITAFWYPDLKLDAFSRFAGFCYRDTGDGEDFPGQEKTQTGMFAKTAPEQFVLICKGNSCSVIEIGRAHV